MAIGKISGVMLKDNLERQGVNLSFDGNLAYFDVTTRRLGIGTNIPTQSLDVVGNARLANLSILGNTITSNTGKIGFGSISSLVVTGGAAYNVILTDGAGNLRFGTLDEISGNTNFTGNTIELGLNSLGTFGGNALALTQLTSVTDSIAQLNQLLGNITNSTGTELHVSGNVNSTNVNTQNAYATNMYGTLQTPAQTNVTTVGHLLGLIIDGNLTVNGNTTFLGYSDLTISDSILNLHTTANLAPYTTNDGKDIGIKMHYYDTQDSHAALVRVNSSGYLEWYARGTEISGNTFSGTAYGTIKTGEIVLANNTPSISTTTGALRVAGGVGIGGNLHVAANIVAPTVVSNTLVATSFTLIGNSYTSGSIYANTAIIGNIGIANSSIVSNNVINFYSGSSAIKVPIGNNSERPVSAAAGYLRYNTETATLEYYDGSGWIPVTNTIESQAVFTGDGSATTFTLDRASPSSGLLVNINGTLQQPENAYTVIGNQITFAEPPQATDYIDIRFLGAAVTVNFDSTVVAAANVLVNTFSAVIDRFETNLYRSARYTISSTSPVDSTFAEVMMVHHSGNVLINTFGILNTGGNTITFDANVNAGNVNLIATGTTFPNQLRIQKTYFAI